MSLSQPEIRPSSHLWVAFVAFGLLGPLSLAQVKPSKAEVREYKREMGFDAGGNKLKKQERQEAKPGRRTPNEAEERGLAKLREQFEVEDDAEWEIIAERALKLSDARTALGTGLGSRGAPPGEKGKSSGRPDQDALRTAVRDRMPDAEIRSRLARSHELFEQNQAALTKAQAEFRAVLTVRQEAIAVIAGLLPP